MYFSYCFCFYQIAFTHSVRVINFFFIHFNVANFYHFCYRSVPFKAGFGIILRKIRFNEHTHCFQCKRPCLENNNFTRRRTQNRQVIFGLVQYEFSKISHVFQLCRKVDCLKKFFALDISFLLTRHGFRGFTILLQRGNLKPFPIKLL